ncbi:MAG: hypothetical protein A2921_01550 [Candidatus Magasanikbacteria bacterium RIFCSPLOWO2_01_FULL_43_20b]|uniref:DAGKc domain-containing protein n=1 Tax=Candidatus Magasanikbacteria bacterium RIFCSPLOWO2_12_FULL_43_12 TaxID=1798692 RepID=A0A1F6MR71_9BACT|nr:MAG: hypothetical protein A3I93_03870 [Candidatus Magasanikbacteria bacterium RIFCSPLOWO2_02_FULL_43_22]OGH72981.1 MAG: hypothetical protein A2921_01550 [Candidatus Magasanikbacteria bacterium RIFCSPLOWO2_01_FULL_43_20b]OGH74164.1 MAG: hypothetical protein A3G00_04840 [Candidatus Magasanikbacteria bacterium RIFCSPLOWO2_12_FULL_43_12]
MYVYLYDNFLKQKKYASILKTIETRLTDFGIAGKIIRLQSLSDAKELAEDEIKKSVSGIVIVGNDKTFGQVLSRAATCETLFGFLPIGPDNKIAEILGIPIGEDACATLSRRRKLRLDLGWFNGRYFVSQLHVFPGEIAVEYDERFKVTAKGKMELVVCNLQPFEWEGNGKKYVVRPQDGKLEAFLRPVVGHSWFKEVYEDPSIFPFQEMTVSAKKPFAVEADGRQSKETKIKIKLSKKRVEMIVGKERRF